MTSLVRQLRSMNLPALAVSLLLLAGLLLEGANNAASAALLSGALMLALLACASVVPSRALSRTWRAHWLSLAAIVIFITIALVSLTPASLIGLSGHADWGSAGTPISLSPHRTLEGIVSLFGPCAAFMLGALLAQDRDARSQSARWLIGVGALYAIAGFALFYAGRSGPRLDVGVSSANVAAAVFGIFAIIAIANVARALRGADDPRGVAPRHTALALLNAPFSLAALLLVFSALLLTASRGGIACALVGIAVLALCVFSRNVRGLGWKAGALGAPLVIIVGALVLLFLRGGEEVLTRLALVDDDWSSRQALLDAHWRFVLERPWLGYGLNTFHELNSQALNQENWRALEGVGSVHNIYVQTLEETGIVGLSLLGVALGAPIVMSLVRVIAGKPGAEWAAAVFAVSVLLLTHGLVDFALQTPAVAALYAYILGAWSTPTAH